MEILVKGHSGCNIDIVNEGRNLYIYKSTYDTKYIDRLYKQAVKQKNASLNVYQHIRIPEIFDIDKTDKHLIIKMEYIYSKNFVDYFEDAGFDNINCFIKALKLFIDKEIKESVMQEVESSIIRVKFEDVCRKINANSCINKDSEVKSLLKSCGDIFNRLPEKIEIPIGQCHGDLTYSNILFNGNNYYLIDFLDSFIESPIMDLVKIRQDTKYQWSQLMYINGIDGVRLKIISDKIDNAIDTYYTKFEWYREYYSTFQLMNFLRILQYAKEDDVISYLKNIIKKML